MYVFFFIDFEWQKHYAIPMLLNPEDFTRYPTNFDELSIIMFVYIYIYICKHYAI